MLLAGTQDFSFIQDASLKRAGMTNLARASHFEVRLCIHKYAETIRKCYAKKSINW